MALACNGSASSANTTGVMAACIGPPSLGIAWVQGGTTYTAGASSVTFTFANAQNAGDAIVIVASGNAATGTPTSISDSAGNGYTLVQSTSSGNVLVWVAKNIVAAGAGTNTVTVVLTGAATFACMTANEYQPSPGNVLSIIDQNFSASTGTTSSSSQTFSPQYCCEMAINVVIARNTTSATGESGWNTRQATTDGTFQAILYQDQIQTIRSNLTITATGLGTVSYVSVAIGLAINAAPPTSVCTIACFVYVTAAPSNTPTAWQLALPGAGDGDGYGMLLTDTPGIQVNNCNGTNPTAKTTLIKQWYFCSFRINGTPSLSQTTAAIGSPSDLIATIVSGGEATYAPSAFAVGIDLLLSGNGGSALNSQGFLTGWIAGLKVWSNQWLSDAELVAEALQLSPVRQADLWGYWSFSGVGGNLNLVCEQGQAAGLYLAPLGTGNVTFAPDPPIARGRLRETRGVTSAPPIVFAPPDDPPPPSPFHRIPARAPIVPPIDFIGTIPTFALEEMGPLIRSRAPLSTRGAVVFDDSPGSPHLEEPTPKASRPWTPPARRPPINPDAFAGSLPIEEPSQRLARPWVPTKRQQSAASDYFSGSLAFEDVSTWRPHPLLTRQPLSVAPEELARLSPLEEQSLPLRRATPLLRSPLPSPDGFAGSLPIEEPAPAPRRSTTAAPRPTPEGFEELPFTLVLDETFLPLRSAGFFRHTTPAAEDLLPQTPVVTFVWDDSPVARPFTAPPKRPPGVVVDEWVPPVPPPPPPPGPVPYRPVNPQAGSGGDRAAVVDDTQYKSEFYSRKLTDLFEEAERQEALRDSRMIALWREPKPKDDEPIEIVAELVDPKAPTYVFSPTYVYAPVITNSVATLNTLPILWDMLLVVGALSGVSLAVYAWYTGRQVQRRRR